MAKKVQGYVKLQVPAGAANPAPPIGPALGQQGVNIMEFCKQFNAATQKVEKNLPIPVIITVYSDRSFTFIMKTPPASVLIRKAIGIEKGSGTPNTNKVGKITRKQLEEIAKLKQPDLTAADLLVRLRRVDAEVHRAINRLVELRRGELLHELERLVDRILLAGRKLVLPGLFTLCNGHVLNPPRLRPSNGPNPRWC